MQILSGVRKQPLAVLVYGVHGIGKSTLGASIPNHIAISGEDIEDSGANRFPMCKTWKDFLDQLDYLLREKHGFKALIVDTIDSIETLLHKNIMERSNANSMASALGGWGKAYEKAMEEMIEVRDDKLKRLREEKGMEIILLAHSVKSKFEDPLTNTSYDTYDLKLHKKMIPVFTEWTQAVLFANFVVYKAQDDSGKKFVIGEGERRMFTEPRPSHNAKNRFNLPYEMDFSYAELKNYITEFYGKTVAKESENKNFVKSVKVEDNKLEADVVIPTTQPKEETDKSEIVLANIRDLLLKVGDKNVLTAVTKAVQNAGKDMKELGRIQNKLIKMLG